MGCSVSRGVSRSRLTVYRYQMVFIPEEVFMSPGFRNVLRFAGVPVDSSEQVRRNTAVD